MITGNPIRETTGGGFKRVYRTPRGYNPCRVTFGKIRVLLVKFGCRNGQLIHNTGPDHLWIPIVQIWAKWVFGDCLPRAEDFPQVNVEGLVGRRKFLQFYRPAHSCGLEHVAYYAITHNNGGFQGWIISQASSYLPQNFQPPSLSQGSQSRGNSIKGKIKEHWDEIKNISKETKPLIYVVDYIKDNIRKEKKLN